MNTFKEEIKYVKPVLLNYIYDPFIMKQVDLKEVKP